jgi:hypothetical protein
MGFNPTFDEVAGWGLPVGIECGRCLRRVLVDPVDTLKARKGDMRRLSEARLHCSRCGSREYAAYTFETRAKATTFMKGYR